MRLASKKYSIRLSEQLSREHISIKDKVLKIVEIQELYHLLKSTREPGETQLTLTPNYTTILILILILIL
jgi:hypothetical protein